MNRRTLPFALLILGLLVLASLGGYALGAGSLAPGQTTTSSSSSQSRPKLRVIATFLPLEEWAREVGGERAEVSLLVPATIDVHDFEPSASSLQLLSQANILVMNGAGLEAWAKAAIQAADNPSLVVVNCSDGVRLIRVPPQFQAGNRAVDPHIWLDPVNAAKMVQNIVDGYIRADPADASYFTANARAYQDRLKSLDQQFRDLAGSQLETREFVTFHTAFAYLAEEYDLTQLPVFGPFQESPTAADIQNVVSMVNSRHLCFVGYESLENPAVAEAIASETHAALVPMNPIEGLTALDQSQGQTYLTMMAQNLLVLKLTLTHASC